MFVTGDWSWPGGSRRRQGGDLAQGLCLFIVPTIPELNAMCLLQLSRSIILRRAGQSLSWPPFETCVTILGEVAKKQLNSARRGGGREESTTAWSLPRVRVITF